MAEEAALLAALQYADSFFPGGAVSFSWGLEGLAADGKVRTAADVGAFLGGQLRARWGACERPALAAAWLAGDDLAAVVEVDRELEALALARELRLGSRRAGGALLSVHAGLGTVNAEAYRALVKGDRAPGHLAAVQGLVWRGAGLALDLAQAASAHALSVGFLGAALRLGIVGHLEAQRILTALRPALARLLAEPPPASIGAYAPGADIAAMRHEMQEVRLFAN